MAVLIKNISFILTQNSGREVLKDVDIFIDNDRITEIGKELKQKAEFVIEGKNKLLMPGLINSHTHLAMTLFRGVADDLPLMEWLKNHIWPVERHLTRKDVYYGSLLACMELIKTGTTCFGDMYFFADEVGKAVKESGIRGLVSSVVLDLLPGEMAGLKTMIKILRKVRELKCGRVVPWLGPHSVYSCSEETLRKVKEISQKENLRINIHLSETRSELEEVKQKYGKYPVEFLNDLNFLDSSVVAVHCVHPTKNEIEILREKDVKVVHCPVSNMKTASGIAPIPKMLDQGICIGLGTDGPASNNSLDLFREMKFATLLHKVNELDPTIIPAKEILDFTTINGARVLGLENQIGSIEVGKKADIIILNLKNPHLRPILSNYSLISHLVYSVTGSDVETVIVDGKILMENRKLLNLDEEDVMEKVQEVAEDLRSRGSKPL